MMDCQDSDSKLCTNDGKLKHLFVLDIILRNKEEDIAVFHSDKFVIFLKIPTLSLHFDRDISFIHNQKNVSRVPL